MSTKLILVEGIPGSGKTTAAQLIQAWLAGRGSPTKLYLEGNWDHPADFESVACLDEAQFAALLAQFPADQPVLERHAVVKGEQRFFSYRKMEQEAGASVPAELIQALARYEIYELPLARHLHLLLERWQEFAGQAVVGQDIYIFECCFLQNPLTMLLGRNNAPLEMAQEHILKLAEIIRPLDPLLIYLDPGNVDETLRRVARTRPPEWLDFVIEYHTQQGHGKAQGWQGFDGTVRFYEMRHAIELDLLPRLPWPAGRVIHTSWEQDWREIRSFLEIQSR
jgi:hypothetical protein